MENKLLRSSGSLVSYFSRGYKAVALPEGEAVLLEDIGVFRSLGTPCGKTKLRICQHGGDLNLNVRCFEPDPELIQADNTCDGMEVWNGDLLEIFFGAIEPVPWQLQLAVGAGGGRFDSSGNYDQWEAKTWLLPDGWQAQIRIPLAMLRLQNLSTGFNLCRQSLARSEFSSWAELETAFHEVENYGELFFCDFETAFFARTGTFSGREFTRPEFEEAIMALGLASEMVAHGPFLSNPAVDAMTVTWATAGMSAAILEYRLDGTEEWMTMPVDRENGILRRNSRLHVAHLTGLRQNTRYQYRLVNFSALLKKRTVYPAGVPFRFCTLNGQSASFSFAACSDIHSNVLMLKKLMGLPGVRQTAFWVNLGDMLSRMSGPDAFFTGFLDLQSQLYAREKPLVCVRGNHEQVGMFAEDYLQILPHPSGKTYYAFQHGGVFFLVLDSGDDKEDESGGIRYNTLMQEEERCWLQKIVKSDAYQNASFRIAFLHMPPYNDEYDSRAGLRILSAIPENLPLDLLLCGHVHQYFRMPPLSGHCRCVGKEPKAGMKNTPVLPYPVVANDTNTLVLVQVTPENLQVRILDCDGRCIDDFSVDVREKFS